jgi:hypothetical protein
MVQPLAIALSAVVIALATFLIERHWGFGLADESYLWYGAQRLLCGEVPMRDFMSYDIGRYLLAGAWMRLEGSSGILALRNLLGLVTVGGVTLATALVARSWGWQLRHAIPVALTALLFSLWMGPRHKVFDVAASIVLVAGICWMLSNPRPTRFFAMGVLVGLLAVLGRNHGVYAVVACGLALLWLARHGALPHWKRALGMLLAGLVVGYAPVWIGMLVIPGFASSMWLSVRLMFYQGSTNLPLPIPWPWKILAATPFDIGSLLVGCFLLGLLVFDALGMLLIWRQKRDLLMPPLFVAAVCVSIPYTHFAFSRADISHLSQGAMPMLIGLLACHGSSRWHTVRRWIVPLVMLVLSLPPALRLHPRYDAWMYGGPWRRTSIGKDQLMLSPADAAAVDLLNRLHDSRHMQGPIFVAPLWPGAYVLYAQRSPVWEIYPLVPRPAAFQQKEIARLQAAKISLAIVLDVAVDGRPALRFRNNHALVFSYLQRCLTQRPSSAKNSQLLVFDGPDHCPPL